MTALAIVAKEQGSKVTGSDVADDFPTAPALAKAQITPQIGFKKENIKGHPDLVVVTGAHGGINNPEAQAARNSGLRVLTHGEALPEFMSGKKVIAVAGSHGKTTVSGMIAHLLTKAGLDPSFAIGCGDIKSLGVSGHAGKGDYFVVEADEYMTDPGQNPTPRFFYLNPLMAVITNIEYDHPDAYQNLDELKKAFLTFGKKVSDDGLIVAGIDNPNVKRILGELKTPILTYGFSPQADYQISRVSFGKERTWFWLKYKGTDLTQFSLCVPGKFNAANALAASIVVNQLGLSWEQIKHDLLSFTGTKRRFEEKGEKEGVKFFDDYAHHPSQIRSTLEAARAWFPKARIICVFQPHTYSRTKALFNEFSKCFGSADQVIIIPIYSSAREKADPMVNSKILVNEINKYHRNALYLETLKSVVDYLKKHTVLGDVVLTMGAGDINKIYQELI